MIRIDFLIEPDGDILGFDIKGHANFSNYGQDIVCSAVSSVIYMVANTITEVLNIPAEVKVDEKRGKFHLLVPEDRAYACRDIFLGLKIHLLSLEEQYNKNIQVNYTEL